MALELLTSTVDEAEVVTVQDPAIRRANTEAAMARYRASSDINDLVVPEDASVIRVRGLTRADRKACERAAGRKSELGAMMHARLGAAAMKAAVDEQVAQMVKAAKRRLDELEVPEGEPRPVWVDLPTVLAEDGPLDATARNEVGRIGDGAWQVGYGRGWARAFESLTDEEARALARHETWDEAYNFELCSRAVTGITGLDLRVEHGRFPFEAVIEGIEGHAAVNGGTSWTAKLILDEVAGHIDRVSRLGKGGLRRSASPSGTTATPSPPAEGAPAGR